MATCRSCGAPMVWATTTTGRAMPVEPHPGGNVVLEGDPDTPHATVTTPGEGTHVSHFATCPNADTHRRTRDR